MLLRRSLTECNRCFPEGLRRFPIITALQTEGFQLFPIVSSRYDDDHYLEGNRCVLEDIRCFPIVIRYFITIRHLMTYVPEQQSQFD